MILRNRKGTAAHLLLEILVCSIIFLIISVFLFGAHAPKQILQLHAHVESADAALNCELSLANLLRAKSSQGLSYSNWLMDSYARYDAGTSDTLDSWRNEVKTTFDKVFSAGKWSLNLSLPNGTRILTAGGIDKKYMNVRDCLALVPFSTSDMKSGCIWSNTTIGKHGKIAGFGAPENDVKCQVVNDGQRLGLSPGADCNLQLRPASEFEEALPSTIENDPDVLDSLTLPILVGEAGKAKVLYEITVEEQAEQAEEVLVTLTRRALLRDCALNITLQTVL
jgi:hypothetical protein